MIVIGIGNAWRRDDGAGPAVVERLADRLPTLVLPGEGTELIEAWTGKAQVIVVDAMRSGAPAGTVRVFDCRAEPLPAAAFPCLSHQFGLPEAIEMARVLDRLPESLTVYGIEGEDFAQGPGLTPAVAAAVEQVALVILSEAKDLPGTTMSKSSSPP